MSVGMSNSATQDTRIAHITVGEIQVDLQEHVYRATCTASNNSVAACTLQPEASLPWSHQGRHLATAGCLLVDHVRKSRTHDRFGHSGYGRPSGTYAHNLLAEVLSKRAFIGTCSIHACLTSVLYRALGLEGSAYHSVDVLLQRCGLFPLTSMRLVHSLWHNRFSGKLREPAIMT